MLLSSSAWSEEHRPLALTFVTTGLTRERGTSTALQGMMQVSLLCAFLVLSFAP
jgi:hypothetical protein